MSYLLPHLHRCPPPASCMIPISTRKRGASFGCTGRGGWPSPHTHGAAAWCSGWAVDQAIMSEEDRLVVVREWPSLPVRPSADPLLTAHGISALPTHHWGSACRQRTHTHTRTSPTHERHARREISPLQAARRRALVG